MADEYIRKQDAVEALDGKIIVECCDKAGIPVFMKDSLIPIIGEENMRRDMPEGLSVA